MITRPCEQALQITENQQSVSDWCEEHYPGETPHQALLNLAEELGELAVEMGEDPAELASTLMKSASRGARGEGDRAGIAGELADLQISLWHMGTKLGMDVQECTDDKMVNTLRPRSVEQSEARLAAKSALGL